MTCHIIPKNSREEIRVSLDDFNGNTLLNIRVWFRADDNEMRPSKKGVAINAALIPDVLTAIQTAQECVTQEGSE